MAKNSALAPMGIGGVVQASAADHPRYTQTHLAAWVDHEGPHLQVVAYGMRVAPQAFCDDPDCPDYARADFPKDRPHYHVGKKVVAPVSVIFAEADSKKGKP